MSISFSERVHNWVSSLVAIWPIVLALLGGTIYGNSETVRSFVHGKVDVPAGELADVEEGSDYAIAIRAINAKLLEHDEQLKAINARRVSGDSALEARVEQLERHH